MTRQEGDLVQPATVTARVPAKVNLELLVGARRADGFHNLSTVYQAVSIYDEVTVGCAAQWGLEVVGRRAAQVPTGPGNLATRAAQLLARHAGVDQPVHLTIRKAIPVAGGMAGGSADAAAALVACDHLWGLLTPREELEELAVALGSDVPFLVAGGTAMGSGRGEVVVPVLTGGTFHWVFALGDEGLSTAAVYAECDRLRAGTRVADPAPSPALMSALRMGDAAALAAVLANDLEDAAFALRPALRAVLEAGLSYGALGGVVSGSGPTVAFLTQDAQAALDLAVSLTASGTAEVRPATGPVHGAHVVHGPTADWRD